MPDPDVAIIAPYPPDAPGDVASYSARLSHALSEQGLAVTVVAPEQAGEPEWLVDGPVGIRRCFPSGLGALPAAAAAATATGAGVVHIQHELFLYGGPGALGGIVPALALLNRAGVGPVVTMHQVVAFDDVIASTARIAVAGVRETVLGMAAAAIVHDPTLTETMPGAVVINPADDSWSSIAKQHLDVYDEIRDEHPVLSKVR